MFRAAGVSGCELAGFERGGFFGAQDADVIDHEAVSAFGEDVGEAVAGLEKDFGRAAGEAIEWSHEGNGIKSPGEEGEQAGVAEEHGDFWRGTFHRCLDVSDEREKDVDEEYGAKGAPQTAIGKNGAACLVDFTRIAEGDHEEGSYDQSEQQ